jgi:hypothetical protein
MAVRWGLLGGACFILAGALSLLARLGSIIHALAWLTELDLLRNESGVGGAALIEALRASLQLVGFSVLLSYAIGKSGVLTRRGLQVAILGLAAEVAHIATNWQFGAASFRPPVSFFLLSLSAVSAVGLLGVLLFAIGASRERLLGRWSWVSYVVALTPVAAILLEVAAFAMGAPPTSTAVIWPRWLISVVGGIGLIGLGLALWLASRPVVRAASATAAQ